MRTDTVFTKNYSTNMFLKDMPHIIFCSYVAAFEKLPGEVFPRKLYRNCLRDFLILLEDDYKLAVRVLRGLVLPCGKIQKQQIYVQSPTLVNLTKHPPLFFLFYLWIFLTRSTQRESN